ncbi:zinc-binding dehydrogenase [Citreicoccus inhibens]|uniref:zinc-binding dehydrogenase n=1 Tax=Citreicoccus inhibens TaxID=2849499 RepID=UPI001F237DE2|nr:zinc-binding dehydrogenase [Citreicoccus inhibens]
MADPPVGAREVRVRVKAVALNHLDVWVRQGWPGLRLELPHVLGSDIAGVVDQVGAEVTDLAPGTEVLVNPGLSCGACERCLTGEDNLCRQYRLLGEHVRGGYAEYVSVPRQNILPKPRELTFAEAACLPLTMLTAWTMLVRRAELKPGETVLVHAAGSGVGSAAVQICKLMGATVIATASTEEKLRRARELGADHTINYVEQDFLEEVKRLTSRRMVDVVFEHTGAATFDKSVACLPYGGRLVTCGATSGHEVKLDLRVLFYKRISLLGSTMGSKGDLFRVLKLVQDQKLRPVLDRTLPLADAAHAHQLLKDRSQFGNIVLIP